MCVRVRSVCMAVAAGPKALAAGMPDQPSEKRVCLADESAALRILQALGPCSEDVEDIFG